MKSILKGVAAILVMLGFSSGALAGSVTGATITGLTMSTGDGAMMFVTVNVSKTSNPACSTSGSYAFVLSLANAYENQMSAMLLSARALGTTVNLTGSGLCDVYSTVETLELITY